MTALTLSPDELVELTGYRSKAKQLEELQRRGFHRARRGASGRVVLERDHYHAVCSGTAAPQGPQVKPPRIRQPA